MMEEKTITIKSIRIKNFMSIVDKTINFTDDYNELVGFNGVGKTTVLSAINWCLFGKDFYDKTQFNIFPIINGNEHTEMTPLIEIEIYINNERYVITRTYIKTNKSFAQRVEINGVQFKIKTDYPNFLKDRMDINDIEFKMLSNIDYAINLPQNDLKDLIMRLVGDISDEDMFEIEEVNQKFSKLKDKIISVGTDVLKNDISQTKTNKNKLITKTIGAIEQEESNISKYQFDETQIEVYKKRREELYSIVDDYSKKVEEESAKEKAINDLKMEIQKDEYESQNMKILFNSKRQEGMNLTKQLENMLNVDGIKQKKKMEIQQSINTFKYNIEQFKFEKRCREKEQQKIVDEFEEKKNIVVKIDNTKCEMCGQELPKDRIDEMLAKKQKLHDDKMQSLVDDSNKLKERIKNVETQINNNETKINELEEELSKVDDMKIDTSELEQTEEIINVKNKIDSARQECVELRQKIHDLDDGVVLKKEKLSMLPQPIKVPSIENTKIELENINNRLSNYNVLEEHKKNYEELQERKAKLDQNIITLDYMEKLLKEYVSKKSELMTEKLQSNFKYIKFKTKSINKQGDVVDCFKVTIDDKEYYTLSGGEKIRASIDLVCGIQKLKNKKLPLLIDCIGELDEFPEFVDTQVICCRAIRKPNENDTNYAKKMTTFSELQIVQ